MSSGSAASDDKTPALPRLVVEAKTLPAVLAAWARLAPDQVALVHGGHRLTYGELADRVWRFAGQLASRGIVRGDRAVLVGDNSISWVVAYLGALRLGAVLSPANVRLNPQQFAAQADLLDAAVVMADSAHLELAAASSRPVMSLDSDEGGVPPAAEPPWPTPIDDALVSFTSGTTGSPKGAVLTHDALLRGSLVWQEYLGTGPDDSTLVLVPLFHNTGFVDQLGHMLVAGGATHLLGRYSTAEAVDELRARSVTFITAVPSILRLLTVAEDAEAAYGQARIVEFGGSPMPSAWTEELRTRWPHLRLIHGYGLSEFTSVVTFLPPELIGTCPESVGYPVPGVELMIADSDGRLADARVSGEIWVRGATRMDRYWANPELTAAKFAGPWLRTGDLGYLDEAGLLWLNGRVDDAINRGGEKVLPAYVESRVAELPEVAEACVFGFADPILQQRVGVAIQLRPGIRLNHRRALNLLRAALPDYAVPEQWVVYDELPRTASGKTDRRAVARDFEQKAT